MPDGHRLHGARGFDGDAGAAPLDSAGLYGLLQWQIREVGTQVAWCAARGIRPSYLSDVLAARRPMSPAMLRAIGVRRVVMFVPLGDGAKGAEEATCPTG